MAISYWGNPKAILLLFALAANLAFTAGYTGSGGSSSESGNSAPITEGPQGPGDT